MKILRSGNLRGVPMRSLKPGDVFTFMDSKTGSVLMLCDAAALNYPEGDCVFVELDTGVVHMMRVDGYVAKHHATVTVSWEEAR